MMEKGFSNCGTDSSVCGTGMILRPTIEKYCCSDWQPKQQVTKPEQGELKVDKQCGNCNKACMDRKQGHYCNKWIPVPNYVPNENERIGINPNSEVETGTTETATHYQVADKQPIEIMQDMMTPEQFVGFLRGNVIKYSLRMGHKGETVKDALKCWQYADWLAKALKGEKIVPGGKVNAKTY